MKEIGGYLELDTYNLPMLHNSAIALNSGRNCLVYLIRKKGIKKMWLPRFLCASVLNVCRREGVDISFYSVNVDFSVNLDATDDWVYLVNYYGQLSNNTIKKYKEKYPNLILDNIQAYFQKPIDGIDTIYTCRKFFGVTDGAFLYSNIEVDDLKRDESFERVHYILGRFEKKASEFYSEFTSEEEQITNWKVLRMSKLTDNLLRAIDYDQVMKKRSTNFIYLHNQLEKYNKLTLSVPDGAYMYPFYISKGFSIRKKLQEKKIYIPTLWPDVFDICEETDLEYDMAKNILPIPVDQRYGSEEMDFIINEIKNMEEFTI